MSEHARAVQVEGEHRRAVQRLQTALSRQGRLRAEHQAARGTPDELTAAGAMRAADDEVAARERWLESVDDHDY